MKKIMLSVLLLSSHVIGIGQSTFPKFVLLEQFTNTWCPICRSQSILLLYDSEISAKCTSCFDSSTYPYDKCPLYLYNKAGIRKGQLLQNIRYTLCRHERRQLKSGTIVYWKWTQIWNFQKQSLLVSVTEKGPEITDRLRLPLNLQGAISGDLRLIVLLAEKNLKFTSQNGEVDHYNVFRKISHSVDWN